MIAAPRRLGDRIEPRAGERPVEERAECPGVDVVAAAHDVTAIQRNPRIAGGENAGARLATHVAEVRRVLTQGGSAGKRLDFLAQELHREANTLGSKSVDSEVSQVALELKVLIEQMREQVQNIE